MGERMKSYTELFGKRGGPYDHAMQFWPTARNEEFHNAVDRAVLRPGMTLADVPAGGGYLRNFLPSECRYLPHEPCRSFSHHDSKMTDRLLPLPWDDGVVDVTFSIAGVHHVDDKRPLFRELARVAKPEGSLVLADVHEDSVVGDFLDGFVGAHNSTGHDGLYLGPHTLEELESSGWQVFSERRQPFRWWFSDVSAMAAFCQSLFDLRHADLGQIEKAVTGMLGVEEGPDGVGMNWELYYIVARKRPGSRA